MDILQTNKQTDKQSLNINYEFKTELEDEDEEEDDEDEEDEEDDDEQRQLPSLHTKKKGVKSFCIDVGIGAAVRETLQFPWFENDCIVTVYWGAAVATGTVILCVFWPELHW